MTVQLIIQSQIIEEIELEFTGCSCIEQREERIKGVANWLKYHYRKSLAINKKWDIIAIQMSKINNTSPGETLLTKNQANPVS